MESDVELTCCVCGKPFKRLAKEHRRNMKRGRKVYCGNSCSAKDKPELRANWNHPDLIEKYLKPSWGKYNRQTDDLSPFRMILRKSRMDHSKAHRKENNLSLVFLKRLWDKQGGICPYTRYKMILPLHQQMVDALGKSPYRASLDRIDSSKGYLQDNVEFVCMAVNFAKNSIPKQQMLDFFSPFRDNQVVQSVL